jgi:hypothetical protein
MDGEAELVVLHHRAGDRRRRGRQRAAHLHKETAGRRNSVTEFSFARDVHGNETASEMTAAGLEFARN